MEISFNIITLIIMAVIIIPFLTLMFAGKKDNTKFINYCHQITQSMNLSIQEYEIWGNTYMGIDTTAKKVIYIRKTSTEAHKTVLDLSAIYGCEILEDRIQILKKDKKESLLKRLDLYIYQNGQSHPTILNFYDLEREFQEDLELARIQKWKKRILDHATGRSYVKKAV